MAVMLRAWLAAIALTIIPPAACATTTWLCSLAEGLTRLVCVADDDDLRDAAAAAEPPATTAVVRGTRFPLDPRRHWVVDMWSPATDNERVAFLARATICYRSPDCEVVMAEVLAVAQLWAPHWR